MQHPYCEIVKMVIETSKLNETKQSFQLQNCKSVNYYKIPLDLYFFYYISNQVDATAPTNLLYQLHADKC